MADFVIKEDTLVPHIPARLEDEAGDAIDLTGATVTFIMADLITGVVKVNATATILVADPGSLTSSDQANVKYAWAGTDTDTPGLYKVEWAVVRAGNTEPERFPGAGYTIVSVTRKIGG